MSIFKACDIRGVVGEDLNEDIARRIGRSLGAMMRRREESDICVGGDFRRSTPALKQALVTGLIDAGATIRDLGQVPTPVVYFAAHTLGHPNLAIVTASHNPARYNGVKFMVAGRPAVPELIDELEAGLDSEPSGSRGESIETQVLKAYESWMEWEGSILPKGPGYGLRVVVDTMGGALAEIAPRVLRAVGCEVKTVPEGAAIDPDLRSRTPNPAEDANLSALCKQVVAERADIGIAFDGDGDRVAFVDHTGRIARPEQIGVLIATQWFKRPIVVYDQKCASALPKAVLSVGGEPVTQPSGYGFIRSTMIEQAADFGVEVSGHYFFKSLSGGDDGLYASLVLLQRLVYGRRPLAELISAVGWPAITPDLRIPFRGDANAVLERIAAGCGGRVSRLDGIRTEYDDGWALARASITEPAMTLRFEGRDRECMKAIATRFLAGAPELLALVMEKINE